MRRRLTGCLASHTYGAAFGSFLEGLAPVPVRSAYGGNVDPATLFLTSEASQAADLAATLFAGTGDNVLVEEPPYYLIERILIDHGLNVISVPTDADGLDTEVDAVLKAGDRPQAALHIPTYRNPNGSVPPLGRRW